MSICCVLLHQSKYFSTLNYHLQGVTPKRHTATKVHTHILENAHFILYLKLIFIAPVKQSHYRPGQAQRVLRKLRFPDFMTTAQDGGKVVSLMHRPPLPPGNTPGTHFC